MHQPAAPDAGQAVTAPRGSLQWLGLWTALLLTAAVALQRIFTTSVSVDEAYSMDTAGRSLAGTLQQATRFELQPPLYFLVLNLWLRIHRTPEFARLLSLGFVLLALVLLYRIGRRLGGDLTPALLPLLAALTAPVAWSAMTARGYALTLLLLIACCHGFVGVWASERPASRWDLPLFILSGVAGIYSFYYCGFAVAGLVAAALVTGHRRRELAIACGVMAAAILPLISVLLAQAGATPTQPETDIGAPLLSNLLLSRTFGVLFWTGALRRLPGLALLTALLAALARETPPRWSRRESLWLVAAVVPWILLLVVDLLGASLVLPRHRMVVLPATFVLLAVVVARFHTPLRRQISASLALICFGLFFVSFERNQEGFDWRAAAGIVSSKAVAGEPVVVFTSDGILPLRWEYRGPNALVPLPRDPDLERYDPSERYLRDSTVVRRRIESAVGPGQSFWLVRRQWLPNIAGDSLLTAYIRRETAPLGAWTVTGIDVVRLRRRTD